MAHGPVQKFAVATMASGATLSTEVDLSKSFSRVYLEIPSMASGTDVFLQGANASGGTFRRIYMAPSNSDDTPSAWSVDSTITNCFVEIPGALRFVKVELGTAMTATTANFNFVGVD